MNWKAAFLLVAASVGFPQGLAWGVVVVQGNVSGEWSQDEYRVISSVTVPSGQELRIGPGARIVVAEGAEILADGGRIEAVGTEESPIVFESAGDSGWSGVRVFSRQSAPPTSQFKHCKFYSATTALSFRVDGAIVNQWTVMTAEVSRCYFAPTVGTAISFRAQGRDASQFMTPRRLHARISPIVESCWFDGCKSGVFVVARGGCGNYCNGGQANPLVRNCFFRDLAGTAFAFDPGGAQSSGTAGFFHNTVRGCERAVFVPAPFDGTVKNNVLLANAVGVERTGSLSGEVFFNCFSENASDFVGYPGGYGTVVDQNVNGDPIDLGFNIFEEPRLDVNGYRLSGDSPAVDAGDGAVAVHDDIDGELRPHGPAPDMGADEFVPVARLFIRGDCNGDGDLRGVTDAAFLLGFNFGGTDTPPCLAACDANGDGVVVGNVTDAIYLLSFNFLGGPPPVSPFPGCGEPRGSDVALGCASGLLSCP